MLGFASFLPTLAVVRVPVGQIHVRAAAPGCPHVAESESHLHLAGA